MATLRLPTPSYRSTDPRVIAELHQWSRFKRMNRHNFRVQAREIIARWLSE